MERLTYHGWPLVFRMLLAVVLVAFGQSTWAAGNIDPNNKYARSEDAGWINFRPTGGGVTVLGTGLKGYAWAENMGWIKLGSGSGPYGNTGPSDWGVNVLIVGGTTNLSGYAWGETCGWINFHPTHSQVTMDPATGQFTGYAWSESVGWIHFQNASPAYTVNVSNEALPNIDTSNSYAFAENAGWVNFNPVDGGVVVTTAGLSGYAWAENVGWIQLGSGRAPYGNTGPSDWGVNVLGGGGVFLSGYAWGENCGWVNFSPTHSQVTIDSLTGRFDGYAWSENVGWIHFRNSSPAYNVKITNRLIALGTVFLFR